MLERAILVLLIAGVLVTYFLIIINVEDRFANFYELKLFDRKAINLLNDMPKNLEVKAGAQCGEYTCIEEPLLEKKGFKIEVIDLEERIIWHYGNSTRNVTISAPCLVNDHLGRVRITA